MNYGIGDILTLLGSLALFLYGMKVMSDALMRVAGDRMRNILASMTKNRLFAVFTGFLITSVIQSSSATTLMVVSFVNAALLTLTESVGVIMGANIGTTVTAWLITILGFKVSMSAIALPLVAFGFLLTFAKKKTTQDWGKFVIGFSVLFIGLQFLKDAVPDLSENPQMLEWLTKFTDMGFASILLFLLIGTILTVVLQSSSATMALTLVMCYEGWIPFDLAVAMVLGENIGTTITANLAALMANFNAKRTARAHFLFNIIGVIWVLILYVPFLKLIEKFVTRNGGASPFESAEAIPVALSVFHTSFNIINTFLLIWFVGLIVKLVKRMVKAKPEEEPEVDQPKYLSRSSMEYPQTAIQALLNESRRLFTGPAYKIMAHTINIRRGDIISEDKIKEVIEKSKDIIDIDIDDMYYTKVKSIYSSILEFATDTQSKFALSKKKTKAINNIKVANRYTVEAVKEAEGIQANIDKYMKSDNEYIRDEYNRLRRKLTKVMREIYLAINNTDPSMHLKALEKLRIKAKKSDILIDGKLDKLIRKDLITSEMAASLANDSNCVADICSHIIQAAELLYINEDTMLKGLDEIDVDEEVLEYEY